MRAVTEDYLRRSDGIKVDTAWTTWQWPCPGRLQRGCADARYAKNLLPWSVVSRPLEAKHPRLS